MRLLNMAATYAMQTCTLCKGESGGFGSMLMSCVPMVYIYTATLESVPKECFRRKLASCLLNTQSVCLHSVQVCIA